MPVTFETSIVNFKNPSGEYIGIGAVLPDKMVNVYNFRLMQGGLTQSDGETYITYGELRDAVNDPASYVTIKVDTTGWTIKQGTILYFSHADETYMYFSQTPVEMTTGGLIYYLRFREDSNGDIAISLNSWAVQNRNDRATYIPISSSTFIATGVYPTSNAVRNYVDAVLSRMKECGILTDAQYQYVSGKTNTIPAQETTVPPIIVEETASGDDPLLDSHK